MLLLQLACGCSPDAYQRGVEANASEGDEISPFELPCFSRPNAEVASAGPSHPGRARCYESGRFSFCDAGFADSVGAGLEGSLPLVFPFVTIRARTDCDNSFLRSFE